jgi:hypothetical protein
MRSVPEIGSSIETAILIDAPNAMVGVPLEYEHVRSARCLACGSRFDIVGQSLLQQGGRQYDKLDIKCANCGSTKSVFFDITRFFGKFD